MFLKKIKERLHKLEWDNRFLKEEVSALNIELKAIKNPYKFNLLDKVKDTDGIEGVVVDRDRSKLNMYKIVLDGTLKGYWITERELTLIEKKC